MTTLLIVAGFLFCLICIILMIRNREVYCYDDFDDEITTTTTTTTTSNYIVNGLNVNGIQVVGMLQRQFENNQPYVIDPVDGDKMWLNTTDDLYEDGAGQVWGLK